MASVTGNEFQTRLLSAINIEPNDDLAARREPGGDGYDGAGKIDDSETRHGHREKHAMRRW
jgi:hypothetical protein